MLFSLILIKINLITLQGFGKSEARISKLFTLCQAFQVSTVTGKKKFVFWSVGWVYIVHLVRSLVHSFGWFVCLLCLFIIYLFVSVLVYSFTCLFVFHSFICHILSVVLSRLLLLLLLSYFIICYIILADVWRGKKWKWFSFIWYAKQSTKIKSWKVSKVQDFLISSFSVIFNLFLFSWQNVDPGLLYGSSLRVF